MRGAAADRAEAEYRRKMMADELTIAGRKFNSRLILGTGKYETMELMVRALETSGTEMVTVAIRRVDLADRSGGSLLDFIDTRRYQLLPNTAGCYSAEEAIRTAMMAREVLDTNWVKLEVIGDERTLFPDNEGLLEATRTLVKEGFVVMPYLNDDLITARKLIDNGAAAVMPLAAPIGSGLGIQNFTNLRIMREHINQVPLIVDAGVGTASDAVLAMEMGVDGLLMNTAVACARDPVAMAEAMRLGVQAGRLAHKAGRIPRKLYASASSPVEGISRLE
jgi:thiazole synthase